MLCFRVFFFKQKTAYEMRISDWSSDVCSSDLKEAFVAEAEGVVLGTYYLRANQAGGGAHVCNAGYMTSAAATGRGVARAMGLHSIDHAKARGFRAMQFNFVVSTNVRAVDRKSKRLNSSH